MFRRLITLFVILSFILSYYQPVDAQGFSVSELPVPGKMVDVSLPFVPLALKGLVVDRQKPLEFQFIVDTGNGPQDASAIKKESNRLVKYFLAGLTIPEGDLWVNLSPYEKDRITTPSLGQTELGRDLLAQDYILKQLTASLIYPEKDPGKKFWGRVYQKAQEQFGTTNIPVNTFNKVWILPDQAQVFEHGAAAYVTKSTLKVMLDEDYLALQKHNPSVIPAPTATWGQAKAGPLTGHSQELGTHSLGSQIVRSVILPELEKEVNTGKNFAPLRQIYDAMILAKWYKVTIQNGLLDAVYNNKKKITGVSLNDPAVKEQIYKRYLQAYKKGVFNYIKEDRDAQAAPRKYFSGGLTPMPSQIEFDGKLAMIHSDGDGAMAVLKVDLDAAMTQAQGPPKEHNFKFVPAKKFYKEEWSQFKLASTTTEQENPLTHNVSQVMNQESVEKGLGLLSMVDDSVVNGFMEFSKKYLNTVSGEIYRKLTGSKGRIIFVGAGSSGRVAVVLAKKWERAAPEKMKGRVVGIIAGGHRAMVRAKEGFEDSEVEGRKAISDYKVTRDDTVILLSGSGSATFNVGSAKEARARGALTYYFYNSKSIPARTQKLFDEEGVIPLLIDAGAQAITGSTRLQAASLAVLAMGSVLEAVLLRDNKNFMVETYAQKMEQNLNSALKAIRSSLGDVGNISNYGVEVFSSANANFRRLRDETNEGYITAIASPFAIDEALVDMTETSPTFSTNPPRSIPELKNGLKRAEFQAFLVGAKTNLDAWQVLVGGPISEPQRNEVLEIPIGGIENGKESFLKRNIGPGNLVLAVLKGEDAGHFAGSALEAGLRQARKQGAKTAMIIVSDHDLSSNAAFLAFMNHEVDAHVMLDNVPNDSLQIVQTLALKMVLNLLSNSIMIRMGKVLGNKMIDVNPSNKKLIARSVRLVQDILTSHRIPAEFLRDDVVLDHVMGSYDKKKELEAGGIYTPSVVKIVIVMISLKVDFDRAVDLLRRNNERLEDITPPLADRAALAIPGGIDFDQINVNRAGKTINVQFDPIQLNELEQSDFKGFTPVITGFQYIQNPFPLLGINPAKEPEALAKV